MFIYTHTYTQKGRRQQNGRAALLKQDTKWVQVGLLKQDAKSNNYKIQIYLPKNLNV